MVLQKNSLVLTMVLIIGSFACACGKKDSAEDGSFAAYTEEVSFTEATKTDEKETAEQWEKGYDLPMNLHPHAVLNRVLWRWYQSPSGFKPLRVF